MQKPAIVSLATAVPPHIFIQNEIAEIFVELLGLNEEEALRVKKLYAHSSIETRCCVLDDLKKPAKTRTFWTENYPKESPSTFIRNEEYKRLAPILAREAAEKALKFWGGETSQITHVISVSCTGLMAPGIEFLLVEDLNLPSNVARFGINFMGCFGAFKGLALASALAKEKPENRILVVCTELCSLHMQSTKEMETFVANALFADGAAAAVIGCPNNSEKPLWQIEESASMAIANTMDKMRWDIGDFGFIMKLSQEIPHFIQEKIEKFAQNLLKNNIAFSECDWAIHPGGKAILQAIEKTCCLGKEQTASSWKILSKYGNMSSATFLYVLHDLLSKERKKWCVGFGFGPGLSMEGILLNKWE